MHTGRPTPGHSSRQPTEFSYNVSRCMRPFSALAVDILSSTCFRCETVRAQLFRRCFWRVVLIEGIGRRYFFCSSPKCQTNSHIPHHHHLPERFPCQAMANPNIQIIPHRTDVMRIYLIHVWVACT